MIRKKIRKTFFRVKEEVLALEFKKIKLLFATIAMAALTACANNNTDDLRGPRNVSTGDLKYPIRNTNMSNLNGNLNVSDRNQNGSNVKPLLTANEIQSMNNGYITIDPNSYSTTIPSQQFPHSRQVSNGQYWYYMFESGVNQPQTGAVNQPGQNRMTAPYVQTPATIPAKLPAQQPKAVSSAGISQKAQQVIELTNNERRKNGLPPLSADVSLSKVAQTKTNDMNSKHYFSHTSPTYGSPFDMMRDFGVTYKAAGENIAMGQTTAQQVVTSWMNSEGHRKNILNPSYTNIGVGYTTSGNYWSQMFIGK
jgi:uncharacterized YkwD family protein